MLNRGRALQMRSRISLDQAQRRIALRATAGIGEMFHPGGSGLGLITGLDQVFERFPKVFGNIKATCRPRVFNVVEVHHGGLEAAALCSMDITLTRPAVDHAEFNRPTFGHQRQKGVGCDEAADVGHVGDTA